MQLRFAAAPRVSIEGMELEREEKCGEARIRQRAGEEKGFIIEKTREEQGRWIVTFFRCLAPAQCREIRHVHIGARAWNSFSRVEA